MPARRTSAQLQRINQLLEHDCQCTVRERARVCARGKCAQLTHRNPEQLGDEIRRVLTRRVDDLLEISRITQGKLAQRKESVSLNACLQDAVEAIRPSAEGAAQMLDVQLPSDELFVMADATRITQRVLNLLTNAVKFTPAGGQVRLNLEHDGRNSAPIFVCDSGVGIAPENF